MLDRLLSVATKKKGNTVKSAKKWMLKAMAAYSQSQAEDGEENKASLHNICKQMDEECLKVDKVKIILKKDTLSAHMKGRQSQAGSNFRKKAILTDTEERAIVDYAITFADRGWPLSNRRIKEHAEHLCRAHHGPEFKGLSKNWASQFLEWHHNMLQEYSSCPLEHSQAQTGNPYTKAAFFRIFKEVVDRKEVEEPIPDELIYGTDESGFQNGIGMREHIVGQRGKKVQHQQRSGDRENTTALMTICTDRMTLPPAIIFKGQGYQTSWKQNNSLNAS